MPQKLEPYVPGPEQLAWAQMIIAMSANIGVIGPKTMAFGGGIYQLDKTAKTFTLLKPRTPWDGSPVWMFFAQLETHRRYYWTWKALGYTVLPAVDWDSFAAPDDVDKG